MAKMEMDFFHRGLVVVMHLLEWGLFLFVGSVWGFWKQKSNSVLVSTEVLSVQRLPAGLCWGQHRLFPSRGGDTAPQALRGGC